MELVYEIGKCVRLMTDKLLTQLQAAKPEIQAVNYQFGHLTEIAITLSEWSKSDTMRFEKFPVVCLLRPYLIQEKAGSDFKSVKMTLMIANQTNPNYKSADRQINNFEPVLLPMYNELMLRLSKSAAFHLYDMRDMPHTQVLHDYWGRQGLAGNKANIFNDYVDAVEIRDLTLNLSQSNCF
jgi:hypothetical protein